MSPRAARSRRTQGERSSATRTLLMQATLECLASLGHAGTTLNAICERAGLSRGAVLHHFQGKDELVAQAFMHRQALRAAALGTQRDAPRAKRSVREEIDAARARVSGDFPVSIEFFNALRIDPQLRARFAAVCAEQEAPLVARYAVLDADLDAVADPLATRYVIGCFLRGLCLEALVSDEGIVESTYAQFLRILEHFHATTDHTGSTS